jgi:hypothetical protein
MRRFRTQSARKNCHRRRIYSRRFHVPASVLQAAYYQENVMQFINAFFRHEGRP